MKGRQEDGQRESFIRALEGKKIPILTLDNKWYRLLTQGGAGFRAGAAAESAPEAAGEAEQ